MSDISVTVEDLEITVETAENDLDISINQTFQEDAIPITVLTDGAIQNLNFSDYQSRDFFIDTALTALTANLLNLGYLGILNVKKQSSSNLTITFQGDGLKFVDMFNDKDNVVASLNVLLGGNANSYFEISLKDSGDTDAGDRIIFVLWK